MAQLLRATLHDIQDGFLVLLDPKGRRDEPRKHPIPLEGKAGEVIKEAADRAKSLKTIWLFSTSGKVPIDPSTVTNYVSDVSVECISNRISTTPFDLGDIRRTIETRLSGMGISKDHRAQLQSHGLSGVQTRHYDRHEYEQEKRHALRVLYQLIESRGEQSAEILPLKRANRIKYRRYVTDLRGM